MNKNSDTPHDFVKSFTELLFDRDEVKAAFPQRLFGNEEYTGFEFRPLILKDLPFDSQLEAFNLEQELVFYYMLTDDLKRATTKTALNIVEMALVEIGIQTVNFHHSEVLRDLRVFFENAMFTHLTEEHKKKLIEFYQVNCREVNEVKCLADRISKEYKNIFTVPEYHVYQEPDGI